MVQLVRELVNSGEYLILFIVILPFLTLLVIMVIFVWQLVYTNCELRQISIHQFRFLKSFGLPIKWKSGWAGHSMEIQYPPCGCHCHLKQGKVSPADPPASEPNEKKGS